ncbi:hypothetical protein ACFLVC_04405 [Chloroflexota bacterium]
MGKFKFKIGERIINTREEEKCGVIAEYHKETGEYGIRLSNGEIHYESPRWLEKAPNYTSEN